MRFNISCPETGSSKKIEIDDEKHIRPFFDRRMGHEIDGEVMGDSFKGYIFKITGGNDAQGFTMKQGIFVNGRSRILFKKNGTLFRQRRSGERKRKSVRGCIVGPDIAVLALSIVKRGEQDIAGVTDIDRPNRLAKKRRNRIISYFNLDKKTDDVRRYVNHRTITRGDKTYWKAPKIQRLITEKRRRRKAVASNDKKKRATNAKDSAAKYEKLISQYMKEKKATRKADDKAKVDATADAKTKK